jgi:hypothetical protein
MESDCLGFYGVSDLPAPLLRSIYSKEESFVPPRVPLLVKFL